MIRKFLFGVDLFGISVPINFSGKEKSSSKLGGTCSLLFFCFIGWAIYSSIDSLVNKKNPSIFMYDSYSEDPKELVLSTKNFPIGIQIEALDGLLYKPFVNESIYKIQVVHKLLERITRGNETVEEKWTITEVPIERCTPAHFGTLAESFASLDLNSIHCVTQGYKLYIQGVYESPRYQSLTISLLECTNSTSGGSCASRDTLNRYLEGSRFNLLYANLAINLMNFSMPTFIFKDSYKTIISPGYTKTSTIELSQATVTTDSGWILQPDETTNFIKAGKITEGLYAGTSSEKVLMSCNFEASKIETSHSRSYKKIQNVLSELGGLAKSLIVIFSILIKPYLKFKVQESLMNELFEVSLAPKLQKARSKSFSFTTNKTIERKTTQKVDHNIVDNLKDEEYCSSDEISDNSETQKSEGKISEWMRQISASSLFLNQPKIKFQPGSEHRHDNFLSSTLQSQSIHPFESSHQFNNLGFKKNLHHSGTAADFLEKRDLTPNNSNMFREKSITIAIPTIFDEPSTPIQFQKSQDSPELNHQVINIPKKVLQHYKSAGPNELSVEKNIIKRVSICDSATNRDNREEKSRSVKNGSVSERIISSGTFKRLNNLIKAKTDRSNTTRLNLWEYICSFVYKTDKLKRKLQVMNRGVKSIHQRLDVINILKKLRELDKLKVLMLDPEQLLLFNSMPRPEIAPGNYVSGERRTSFSRESLKRLTFIPRPAADAEIISTFGHIKSRRAKTNIDRRLIEIFEEIDC